MQHNLDSILEMFPLNSDESLNKIEEFLSTDKDNITALVKTDSLTI